MKINLRKSAAIQQEILQVIKSLAELKSVIEFNEFELNIEDKFNQKRAEYLTNQQLMADLYTVYYTLRNQTSSLNQETGINKILADIELNKKLVETATRIKNMSAAMDLEMINRRLEKIRSSEKKDLYFEKTVDTNCVNAEDIKNAENSISKYKQNIRQLSDDLLELNVQTKLTIDPQQYQILVTAGIVS